MSKSKRRLKDFLKQTGDRIIRVFFNPDYLEFRNERLKFSIRLLTATSAIFWVLTVSFLLPYAFGVETDNYPLSKALVFYLPMSFLCLVSVGVAHFIRKYAESKWKIAEFFAWLIFICFPYWGVIGLLLDGNERISTSVTIWCIGVLAGSAVVFIPPLISCLNGILTVITTILAANGSVEQKAGFAPNIAVFVGVCVILSVVRFTDGYKRWKANRNAEELARIARKNQDLAECANHAKDNFLANMSHEIRTPINAVIGMNEMILRESNQPEIRDYANDIASAGRSLLNIINDILDLSKIESGKMDIFLAEYDVGVMINDLVKMIRFRAESKNLALKVTVDPQLPSKLIGDDVRIRQIISNLLTNAVKYCPAGSVSLIISAKDDGRICKLHVEVRDTGIGIKKEDLPKLCMAFERIEEQRNRKIEGTGLGMSITSNLLKLMNSKLEVSSVYGLGSTFSFTLDQEIADSSPLGDFEKRLTEEAENYTYSVSYTAPDAQILVVDDNDLNRKVFVSLLKGIRCKITTAESGFKALDLIREQKFDVIFLDHLMPDMDGIETLEKMKGSEHLNNNTPVVALTANAVSGAKEIYMNAGFDRYLTKPIMPSILEATIKELIPQELIHVAMTMPGPDEHISASGNGMSLDEIRPTDGTEVPSSEAGAEENVEESRLPELDDFDWEYARSMLVTDEIISSTALVFYKSLDSEFEKLTGYFDTIDNPDSLKNYKICVHALKSTTKMLGNLSFSALAKAAELAAGEENIAKIKVLTPLIIEELTKFKSSLSVFDKHEDKPPCDDLSVLKTRAEKIRMLLDDMDFSEAETAFKKIDKFSYEPDIQKIVNRLGEKIIVFDMDAAGEIIDELLENLA